MKAQNSSAIKIEKFSKKRYETYKAEGIPFRVVDSDGRLCEIRAFDCGVLQGEVFFEVTQNDDVRGYYANQKTGIIFGRDSRLYIYLGPWFEKDQLVVSTSGSSMHRSIFFWGGVLPSKEEFIGRLTITETICDDISHTQFCDCGLFYQICNKEHLRLATDKDTADYCKALRDHRVTWEDDGHFYHYPHVGDHYYEIYFNHGVADFRECILESEATRPEISRLIMECDLSYYDQSLRESRVRERVKKINEALGIIPKE